MSRVGWAPMAIVLAAACHDPQTPPGGAPALLDPADHDRDGHRSTAAGGDDCDDAAPHVFADAPETCDGRDEDCDGFVDDGFDCAPGDERPCGADPAWVERCGRDCAWSSECERAPPLEDDCAVSGDGCWPGQPEACETECGEGQRTCGPGCAWKECAPPREWCNGLDDDCDGEIDEGTWSLGGAIAEHPWTGTTERFAAAVTTDGRIAIVQTTADPEGAGAYLTWGVHDGPSLGPAIPLTDDATDVRELVVAAAGPRVLCALGRSDRVDLQLVGKADVEVSWTIDGDLPDVRLAAAEDESVVIAGGLLLRFDADGRAVGAPVPLAEPVRELVWTGEALVAASPGALEWLSLEGDELARTPIDADGAPVVATAGGAVVAAFPSGAGEATLAGYDVLGVEQWRATTAVDAGLTVDAVGWSHVGLMPSPVGPAWLVSFVTAGADRAGWLVADGGEVRRSLTRWPLPRALERVPSILVSGSSVNALVFGHDGVSAAPVGCHPDECSEFSWLASFRSGHESPFSAVIRLDDVSLEPKGFAFIGASGHESVNEDAAREVAGTMIDVDGELELLEPRGSGNFVLRDDGDAGLDAAVVLGSGAAGLSVTRRPGERATFGFPEEFEALSAMSGSCGFDTSLWGDGFDLDTGEPLDPVVLAETFRAADATPVPAAIVIGGYVFAATAVRYRIDDARAERAVVLWGGYLE